MWVMAARPLLSLALLLLAQPVLGENGERCAPATTVDGDETLAAAVARELAARGIGAVAASGCAAARAHVTADDDSVIVEIADAEGRRVARRASTAAAAATVIESWTRTELTDDLLERRAG